MEIKPEVAMATSPKTPTARKVIACSLVSECVYAEQTDSFHVHYPKLQRICQNPATAESVSFSRSTKNTATAEAICLSGYARAAQELDCSGTTDGGQ